MKFAKKTDLIILAALVFACAGALLAMRFAHGGGTVRAEIYRDSRLVKTVALPASPGSFSLDGVPGVTFETYADGSIAFARSDCPDQVCVHTGRLSAPGQFAACLPNGLYVKIVSNEGEDANGVDIAV